ncbi:MAG: sulfatase-like hydrolase/transferase [Clostridia bacterium]|nr:sulfatase-like hydrolase/transferase [Clostridia bacterium]
MTFNNIIKKVKEYDYKNAYNKAVSYVDNSFEVTSTKTSKLIGVITSFVLMFAVIFLHKQYTEQEFATKWLLLAFSMLFPFLIGAVIAYTVKITNDIISRVWHIAVIFLLPILTLVITECLNGFFIYDMTYWGFLGNYLVILLLYFLFFVISGSVKISSIIVNTILFGLAVVHAYIMNFRGTPFIPMDFLSITTAKNVANTYDYTPSYNVIIATLLYIFIIILSCKTKMPTYKKITKIITKSVMTVIFVGLMGTFYLTNFFTDLGVKPDFWNQARGYRNYGFVFSFFCNTKYLYMSVPNGYYAPDVGKFVKEKVEDEPIKPETDTPNIICIMNESLSDLNVLGEVSTNEDFMPFMRSLNENTVKGNLYVPVVGAGTSNTEFEFLTGHTTAFLPSGSNAYMLYINNPISSLVSTLKAQGYSSLAFHPYYASGWNRTNVYNYMGFNKFVSLENIMDVSLMDDYISNGNDANYLQDLINQYYPDREKMILRQYISDSYDFRYIINDYENRDKSQAYFCFNVTMQNHGGYTMSADNFNECISINSETYYNKASKYLSLVKASDDAFKELIDYFSNVNEKTIICMFGDHQPSIETSYIASLLGVNNLSNLTIEQEQKRHITPFYIWANYDIEEKNYEMLSSNYLSSLVLKTAGVKLSDYNKYLLKLSETLPVIDTVGYIDNNGNYYAWNDKSEYSKLLSEYEKIQYNAIFDFENTDSSIFFINGFTQDNIMNKQQESEE